MTKRQCTGRKATGTQCARSALEGRDLCAQHYGASLPGYVAKARKPIETCAPPISSGEAANLRGVSAYDQLDAVGRAEFHVGAVRDYEERAAIETTASCADWLLSRIRGHAIRAFVALLEWMGEPIECDACDACDPALAYETRSLASPRAAAIGEPPCAECGGAVPADRLVYVTPVCHACLPLPEPLPVCVATLPEPLFDDGRIVLYCGDSLALMPLIIARHGRPDHTLTDPPYSPKVIAGARTSRGTKNVSAGPAGADGPAAFVPFATTADEVRHRLALCDARRWTLAFCDHKHAAALDDAPPPGMRANRIGIWVKPDCAPQMNGKGPANGFESIAILHHETEPLRWNSAGKRGVWTHYVERDVPWHPTPKPVPLFRELLRDFTDPDEMIFDPYAGSGSLGVAARFEGRRAILVEIDRGYAEKTAQRLREGRARVVDLSMPEDVERTGQRALFARSA